MTDRIAEVRALALSRITENDIAVLFAAIDGARAARDAAQARVRELEAERRESYHAGWRVGWCDGAEAEREACAARLASEAYHAAASTIRAMPLPEPSEVG